MTGRKNYIAAFVFVIPAFILYTVFYIIPVFQTGYMSFFEWNGIKSVPLKFVGISNFVRMFNDKDFYVALKNVCAFIASGFLLIMPTALAFAMIITGKFRLRRFFKTAFFMPVVMPLTAVALMWQFLLMGDGGMVNSLLIKMGLKSLTNDWLGNPFIAIYVVVVVNAWIYSGLNMIIFSAGMVAIPEELHEAASIDGATSLKKFWYITIPLMKETFKIFAILNVTQSLRVFGQIFVMTGGGPNGSTDVPATLLYYESFKYNHFGLGNSIGIFIIIVSLFCTVVMNKLFSMKENN